MLLGFMWVPIAYGHDCPLTAPCTPPSPAHAPVIEIVTRVIGRESALARYSSRQLRPCLSTEVRGVMAVCASAFRGASEAPAASFSAEEAVTVSVGGRDGTDADLHFSKLDFLPTCRQLLPILYSPGPCPVHHPF